MNPLVLVMIAGIVLLGMVAILWLAKEKPKEDESQSGTPAKKKSSDEREATKEKLRERLIRAGLYKQNSLFFYYMLQLTFFVLPLSICLVGYRAGLYSLQIAVVAGAIFGILGVIGPGLWLDYLKSARQTSIRRSIPDALDVITICVEAGLSLNSAIVRVSKDLSSTYPMLATELAIVHRQMQLGKTAGEALRSFAERFDLSELRSLASVVAQSEKFGASIAKALRSHGESLRKKRMQMAHERAQKAAVWILIPTVLCIFPALFVVILGPAGYDIAELMNNMKN